MHCLSLSHETVLELLTGWPMDQQHWHPGSLLEIKNPDLPIKILWGLRCTLTAEKFCSRKLKVCGFQTFPVTGIQHGQVLKFPPGKHCHFS